MKPKLNARQLKQKLGEALLVLFLKSLLFISNAYEAIFGKKKKKTEKKRNKWEYHQM